MIVPHRPEICNPSVPGCELKLPLYTEEERKRIENMIDFPGEYTADDFRSALDLCFKRSTEAEAFIRSLHDYTLRLKGVWHRWLGALRPTVVRKS